MFGQDISVEEKFEALKLLEPKQWMPDVTPKRCLFFAAGNWLAKWLQIVSTVSIIGYITVTQQCWDGVALNDES